MTWELTRRRFFRAINSKYLFDRVVSSSTNFSLLWPPAPCPTRLAVVIPDFHSTALLPSFFSYLVDQMLIFTSLSTAQKP